MKALVQSGLVVALGLLAARSFAQEVQWRARGANSAPAVSETATASPAASRAPLGQPQVPANTAAVRTIDFRPLPTVFRAKTDEPRPLPSGPALGPMPAINGDSIKVIVDEPAKDEKKDEKKEKLTFPPKLKIMPAPDGVYSSQSLVCPSSCCCETIICTDCCTDCCMDCCCNGMCPGPLRLLRNGVGSFWGDPRGDYCNCRGHIWLSAEYLLWHTRDQNVPPLVTTSPDGTAQIDAGVLGRSGTRILFDQGTLENNDRSGGRFTLGFWLPFYCDVGLEASYMFLGRHGQSFTAASTGSPILARPLVDATTGTEISQLVAFPGLVAGSVSVDYSTRLWGLEANVRHKLCCGPCGYLDLIYGYRHLQLEDDINITESLTTSTSLGIVVRDSFATRNLFNGGQIGLDGERRLWRRWFVGGYGKIAFGINHEIININGSTTFSTVSPGVANPQPAGILALGTNSGHFTRDRFAILPEVGIKLGYDINEHLRVWAGYSALWLTEAVRAGEQIDRVVNRSQIPNNVTGIGPLVGTPRPLVPFNTQTFWASGFTFGLEYRY